MEERYSRLFTLEHNLYSEGSPVIITAGALLKDNMTGNVLAQLKIKNINEKPVKAVKIKIFPLDTVGNPLGGPELFQYLDLDAKRDEEFGQKQPNVLSDNTTRSFSVEISEVYFADKNKWEGNDAAWEPIQDIRTLDEILSDQEMLRQYRIRFGYDCNYVPEKVNDLWYCTCGGINRDSDQKCHNCNKSFEELTALDLSELEAAKDTRLKEAAEKATEEKVKAAAKKKKTIKLLAIVLPLLSVIIIAVVIVFAVIIPSKEKSKLYDRAQALFESGDYFSAFQAFEKLGNYKDSHEKGLEADYQRAELFYSQQDYGKAIVIYKYLSDYKDSEQKYNECTYRRAELLFSSGDYDSAIKVYERLNGYKDSEDKIKEALKRR